MKKVLIILGFLLAILAAYWLAYGINPIKKMFGTSPDVAPSPNVAPAVTSSPGGNFSVVSGPAKDLSGFPLSIGSTGKYVSNLQTALNSRFGSELVVDGIFGNKTAKALSAHGYNPDAIYWKHYYGVLGVKI